MENMKEMNLEELESATGGRGGSPTPLSPKAGCLVYQIKRGDKLGMIAKRYNTTCAAIKAVNSTISNINDITEGYYIYIPQ